MNNKKIVPLIIWEAVYPVALYYALLYVCIQLLYYLGNHTNAAVFKAISSDYALLQLIGAVVTIPFIFSLYCNDRNERKGVAFYIKEHPPKLGKRHIVPILVSIVGIMLMGFGMNNLLYMTPLVTKSAAFQAANADLYSGTLVTELLSSGFFIAILEELVYRGVLMYRIKRDVNRWCAILVSTLIFALMHANIVQIIYAFVLGLLLALLVEKTGHIYVSIIGHAAINSFAVVRSELGLFKNLEEPSVMSWVIAITSLLAGIVLIVIYCRDVFGKKKENA